MDKGATEQTNKQTIPGVVEIGKKPLRSTLGALICQIVMATRMQAMAIKKIAVGRVHAIHVKFIFSPR